MVVVLIVSSVLLMRTRFGRYVFAIGGNEEAARLAGIRPRRVVFTVFVVMGALAGLAGLLNAVRFPVVDPNSGNGLELETIAAVVVGGGNSAAEASLEMYRAGAHVTLVHRAPTLKPSIKYWVRPDIENRIKEGSIAAQFSAVVREIRPTSVVVAPCRGYTAAIEADVPVPPDGSAGYVAPTRSGPASEQEIPADAMYLLTGYRADTDLMVRAGIELTARHGPVHDPQTFETNVPNLFIAGGAIAGKDTGTIFIENGRFHGDKIVEAIAERV